MEELVELIKTIDDLIELENKISQYHPYDIANIFDRIDKDDRKKLYQLFDEHKLADIFSYIDEPSDFASELGSHHLANIINQMNSDDAADTLNEMEEEKVEEILSLIDKEQREEIIELVKYEDSQTGSIMDTNFIQVTPDDDVKVALKKVIAFAPDCEDIENIFVIKNEMLMGILDIKKLITAKHPTLVSDIMAENFHYASPKDDVDVTIKMIKDYDIYTLPIIDNEKMIGVVTMDDALMTMVYESNDDYAKFSGLTSEEEQYESTIKSVKKRIPWLAILLVLDFFVTMVVSTFEQTIQALPILVFFQTVILGLAGNAGTQSLAVSVRKLGQGELKKGKTIIVHLLNELFTGISLGIILGLSAFCFVSLFLFLRGETQFWIVSFSVSLAIFIAMGFSSLFGALIPILFDKLKIDPAVASGPFITTLNDIIAVLIYFGISTLIINCYFI